MKRTLSVAVVSILGLSSPIFAETSTDTTGEHVVTEQKAEEAVEQANTLSVAFEHTASIITPSVVTISSIKHVKPVTNSRTGKQRFSPFPDPFKDFFGDDFLGRNAPPEGNQRGMGTGVIIDSSGLILTNHHVVGDFDDVRVSLNDDRHTTYKAEIKGTDPRTDLALIKIKAEGLTAAKLGDSDKLKIGEWVIAAGNPFGLQNTITAGIVSAKGRAVQGGAQFEDFIQTDAAINPGNSGGPLVDLKGQVIGINTSIYSRSGGYEGIGFAIPINMARQVMESLSSKGRVVRGWLGVEIANLDEDQASALDLKSTDGAVVRSVQKSSPADRAGMELGDIIVSFNGHNVKDSNQLRNLVAATGPGQDVNVDVNRNGTIKSLSVNIEELKSEEVESIDKTEDVQTSEDLGLELSNLTPELAHQLRSERGNGVVIIDIEPGSLADEAGLQPKDIIISVDGEEVGTVKEFKTAFAKSPGKKVARLVVESQGKERLLFLKRSE